MGTLHHFPVTGKDRNHQLRDVPLMSANFARQLSSLSKTTRLLAKAMEAPLSSVLDRLDRILADMETISRLLPPGPFKTEFDLQRNVITAELETAKSIMAGL